MKTLDLKTLGTIAGGTISAGISVGVSVGACAPACPPAPTCGSSKSKKC